MAGGNGTAAAVPTDCAWTPDLRFGCCAAAIYTSGMQYTSMFPISYSRSPMISELGFGCASLGGKLSKKDSLSLLGTALDSGITLFDTARSYGYGQSESIVGEFLKGRRGSAIVCTKFGIIPATSEGWKRHLKPMARATLKTFPSARSFIGRQAGNQLHSGHFSVDSLRSSLETSLRELRTDYVDIFLFHAAPVSILAQEDLLEAMGRQVESGKVRVAGISGDLSVISQYFELRPHELSTAQFAMNFSHFGFVEKTQSNGDLLLIGNNPFGGPGRRSMSQAIMARIYNSPELPKMIRQKLDLRDPQILPELTLNCALRSSGLKAVVAGMAQAQHILSNVEAVNNCRFSIQEISVLRNIAIKVLDCEETS
jgi:diketogulonate reductase-like aldo/keto reductase